MEREREKAEFRTRSLHGKKVCVFLFLNCLHPPDQLLPAGGSRRAGGGEQEKRRKRRKASKEGGECGEWKQNSEKREERGI